MVLFSSNSMRCPSIRRNASTSARLRSGATWRLKSWRSCISRASSCTGTVGVSYTDRRLGAICEDRVVSETWARDLAPPGPLSEKTRRRLSRQASRDTRPEIALRRALHRRGLRFRIHFAPVPGLRRHADVVFTRAKVAVFVDGCFWHRCSEHGTAPKNNAEWWRRKLQRNVDRDRETDARLRDAGWTVVRVWEHESIDAAADAVVAAVRGASGASSRGSRSRSAGAAAGGSRTTHRART